MKHASKILLTGAAFLCATSLSFGWSDQDGVALSVASAQARVGRPATPVSVAGVARRNVRRGAYVGAGVAGAAALGAAGAYYRNAGYGYGGGPYGAYGSVPYGAYGAGPYGAYGYGYHGASCAPAPRIAAFATQPWDNMPTCPF